MLDPPSVRVSAGYMAGATREEVWIGGLPSLLRISSSVEASSITMNDNLSKRRDDIQSRTQPAIDNVPRSGRARRRRSHSCTETKRPSTCHESDPSLDPLDCVGGLQCTINDAGHRAPQHSPYYPSRQLRPQSTRFASQACPEPGQAVVKGERLLDDGRSGTGEKRRCLMAVKPYEFVAEIYAQQIEQEVDSIRYARSVGLMMEVDQAVLAARGGALSQIRPKKPRVSVPSVGAPRTPPTVESPGALTIPDATASRCSSPKSARPLTALGSENANRHPVVGWGRATDTRLAARVLAAFPCSFVEGRERRQAVFMKIVKLKKSLRHLQDRQQANLVMAKLYLQVRRFTEAMSCLKKAVVRVDNVKQLLEQRPPEQVAAEQAKLARLSKTKRELYLEQRARELELLASDAVAAQEKRINEAHFLLFHCYLLNGKADLAERHIKSWLEMAAVREDAIVFIHKLLTKLQAFEDGFRSEYAVLMHRSLGQLPDLHLELVEELCRSRPDNAEYLQALGRAYTRRRDYEKARLAYDRLLKVNGEEEHTRDRLMHDRPLARWTATYEGKNQVKIGMSIVSEWFNEESLEDRRSRQDCVKGMIGPHEGCDSVIYSQPATGWMDTDEIEHNIDISKYSDRTRSERSSGARSMQSYKVAKEAVLARGLLTVPEE